MKRGNLKMTELNKYCKEGSHTYVARSDGTRCYFCGKKLGDFNYGN
jgi:hypothetical protein